MRTLPVLLLVLAACGAPEAPPPGLLDRATFKHVLLRAQLVEARLNHELVVGKRGDSPIAQYYAELFQEEGVTQAAFDSTFAYYAARPEAMKAIYQEILTELDSLKEREGR